jgi:hypothetical protein
MRFLVRNHIDNEVRLRFEVEMIAFIRKSEEPSLIVTLLNRSQSEV